VGEPPGESDPAEELARLRQTVNVLAELLIERGIVDSATLVARLSGMPPEVASPPLMPRPVSRRRGFLGRLFGRSRAPAAAPRVDDSERVGRVAEPHSLYSEAEPSTELSFPPVPSREKSVKARARAAAAPRPASEADTCCRCWRRVPLGAGRLCARCAILPG
jgi:hypothetical protein